MQGIELVKGLAELEIELANKLEEARRLADQRIAKAEEEARRILKEADAQINQLEDSFKARIAAETGKLREEARAYAEKEALRIRQQADSGIERAVEYVLSEVLP